MHAFQSVDYLAREKRLRNKNRAARHFVDGGVSPTTRDDDFHVGPPLSNLVRQHQPVHFPRHIDVSNERSDGIVAFEDTHGFGRRRGSDRRDTGIGHFHAHKIQNKKFVLDDEKSHYGRLPSSMRPNCAGNRKFHEGRGGS
jgi:hypothetical protein